MSKDRKQTKSGTKVKKRGSSKKRKKGSSGGGGEYKPSGGGDSGGGGVLMSMRGGFKKVGHAVTGTGEVKKQSTAGKIANYTLTVALLLVLAYLVWKRFLQGG